VERVHFERVDFKTKNFDMVFIFRDYKRPVGCCLVMIVVCVGCQMVLLKQ
jgi:nucleosome binding factor SPN SPT16 subunit